MDIPSGPETKANTATWGRYVRKKRAARIPTLKRIPLNNEGRIGLMREGSVRQFGFLLFSWGSNMQHTRDQIKDSLSLALTPS